MDPCNTTSCLMASSGETMSFLIVTSTVMWGFFNEDCNPRLQTWFEKGPIAKTQQISFQTIQPGFSQLSQLYSDLYMHRTEHGCIMSKVSSTLRPPCRDAFESTEETERSNRASKHLCLLCYCRCL